MKKFILLVLLQSIEISISYAQNNIDSTAYDTTKLVIKSNYKGTAFPEVFEAAFYDSTTVYSGGVKYSCSSVKLGTVKLETGKLIVGDPVTIFDATPLKYTFPIGSYPVELACTESKYGKVVTYSRILFSKEEVVKWEFALKPNQKEIDLIDTVFYCFGVDASTAMFIDQKVNKLFSQKPQTEWDTIFTKLEAVHYEGYIHNFEGHNFAVFSTGYGDGCYGVYIGKDKNGKICRVLIDFSVLNWWDK